MNIAIIGCGIVGSAVAKLLTHDKDILRSRTNVHLDLLYIVDIDFTIARQCKLNPELFCNSYENILKDDSLDVVVELVGGLTIAKEYIEKALKAKKHVVTANKALLALHGQELISIARKNGVSICFEASCGGGIPIIRALTDGLIANRITAMYGILNGTCNYILTAMTNEGKSYKQALKEAQTAGFAETNPLLDVSGIDTAHKLAILAALAFGKTIVFESIPVTGIDTLSLQDIAYGQELGYVIKLLAIAKQNECGISLCVRPAFISKEHPLAWVAGPFNAISVYSHATGHTMYYGRGAGGKPTASAILADLHSLGTKCAQGIFDKFIWPDKAAKSIQLPADDTLSRYYIRIMIEDSSGVLAKISAKLGDEDISLSSVLQKEPPQGSNAQQGVPVVITTHKAREGSIKSALKKINNLDVVKTDSVCIEIVDEYPESL